LLEFSSKPRANMMMIIPIFESPSMNGEVSTGRMPMLTISDPKARK
jgi:hypothetical protein